MSVKRIAFVGEAMVELSLSAENSRQATIGFAGDTLNSAIYLKRAAPQLDVAYVTKLGKDSFSDQMIRFMQTEGINTDPIERSQDRMPGLYAINTDAAGERSFSYWRGQSAAKQTFQSDEGISFGVLGDFDAVFLSAITLAILEHQIRDALIEWLASYRTKLGGTVIFDSNYRPALWDSSALARDVISAAWRQTDIALPSIDDEFALFGDTTEEQVMVRLASYGIQQGALKRADRGPISLGPDRQSGDFAPAPVVVDTTAAGDSFNGGFLGEYLHSKNPAIAMKKGHDLASYVVGYKGAIAPPR